MMREERILTRRSHSANASIVIQVCILNSSFFYYFRFTRESDAAILISEATAAAGMGLVELRRIEASREVAGTLAKSPNVTYLPGGNNMMMALNPAGTHLDIGISGLPKSSIFILQKKVLYKMILLLLMRTTSGEIVETLPRSFQAVTGDTVLLRCQKAKKSLEQSLIPIQSMVPVVLAVEVSRIVDDLERATFVLDSAEEEAGKVLTELLQQGTSNLVSAEDFELKALEFAAPRLNITSQKALLIEGRSIKKLLDKIGPNDQKKKSVVNRPGFLCRLIVFNTVYLRLTLLNSSWLRFQFSSIVSTIVSSFLIRSSEKFRSISVSCLNCDSKQNENVTYAKKMMREERILTRRSHSANASIVIQDGMALDLNETERESDAAILISEATAAAGMGLVELRRIEASREVAGTLAKSPNVTYLPGGNNMMMALNPAGTHLDIGISGLPKSSIFILQKKVLYKMILLLLMRTTSGEIVETLPRSFQAVTGDTVLLRCQKAKKSLEQSLIPIQSMVPVVLAVEVSRIVDDLERATFVLDSAEEEAGKVLTELLQQGTSNLVSAEDFELKALEFAAPRLNITSQKALLIEGRSIKKLLDKIGPNDQKKKSVVNRPGFLCRLIV
ncbi:hypothetical protein RYX36_016073 [Vicia faba]